MSTIDPRQIQDPSQIPPQGAEHVGLSPAGLVDVYSGTLAGDTDAVPSAQELLNIAPDTGGLSNADYIYDRVSKLYGGIQLPDSGPGSTAKSMVFVSGSSQGGYGAFHIGGSQIAFDRLVLDSLNASGTYSSGSGLASAIAPQAEGRRRAAFVTEHGPAALLSIIRAAHALQDTRREDIVRALVIANHSVRALEAGRRSRDPSAMPGSAIARWIPSTNDLEGLNTAELANELVRANLMTLVQVHRAAAAALPGRQYLSTALFAAEVVESFQLLANNANAGRTDGEAVSRVLAFKLAPEIALVPGFNAGVTQQWWQNGHADWVKDNSQNDQSTDGNASGLMFLLFLNDYLGVPLDQIIQQMPKTGGAPLAETYVNLLGIRPGLARAAGANEGEAFAKMISLLEQTKNADGTLNLPADGNPFPNLPGAQRGGLFAAGAATSGALFPQDTQNALSLEAQLEQQAVALKGTLQNIQARLFPGAAPPVALRAARQSMDDAASTIRAFGYGPRLPPSAVASLSQRAAAYRAPQVDAALQNTFWPHVYNELPGSGTSTYRLQVITGTDQAPQAVQISGTVQSTRVKKDGNLHLALLPDDPSFPANRSSQEPPLEAEFIYAGPVTQADAQQASEGYTNPIDISQLSPNARVRITGPLIYDRAHGKVDANGNVQYGLEIHPVTSVELLGPQGGPPPWPPSGGSSNPLDANVASALTEATALGQTVADLTSLLQKMQGEVPSS